MISLELVKKNKLVSIIITTKNEADVIEELLKSCLNQSYKKIEVIVVDNYSKNGASWSKPLSMKQPDLWH